MSWVIATSEFHVLFWLYWFTGFMRFIGELFVVSLIQRDEMMTYLSTLSDLAHKNVSGSGWRKHGLLASSHHSLPFFCAAGVPWRLCACTSPPVAFLRVPNGCFNRHCHDKGVETRPPPIAPVRCLPACMRACPLPPSLSPQSFTLPVLLNS